MLSSEVDLLSLWMWQERGVTPAPIWQSWSLAQVVARLGVWAGSHVWDRR